MQVDNLSWFPGHMTKTRRMITAEIKNMDAVCEILDARIPLSSRNPDVDELTAGKPRLEVLNRERGTTILMVTHDAFTASCCHRVVFLRDGRIFKELRRGEGEDRRTFFQTIIRVVTQLGGEMEDVL